MIKKRVSNRSQNNMGEITEQTRLYVLPFTEQGVKIVTRFEYDSWGRTLNMTYPDGEKLTYEYDRGGQLKSMQGVKDSCTYNYLINQKYDKFGAKTEMAYGNYMVNKYMYNPLNLRLDSLVASLQSNNYFSMGYRYDAKGNVTQLHSKYSCFNGNNPITQTFVYDSTDQLTDAQGTFYTTTVTYGNTGKIATYSSPTTPNTTFYYPDIKPTSTVFAPDSSFDGDRFTYYDFGINGSLRRKWHYEGDEFNREERGEYYWFNAFNCMKAYSFNGERYGYYGYDASGERTYKINVNPDILYINAENVSMTYHIDRYMLYPNGYMNVNQAGEYTKHYYADALRIASKIGGNYDNNFCDSVAQIETDYPEYITHRKNEQEFAMKNELDSVTKYNIITSTLLFDAPNECLLHGGFEEEVFYYHPDHLGSTGMVTNKYANITQALLYAPFGEIVNEYNPGWSSNRVPKYSFNAKEFDEENGMYYYSARYYAPPTFISRDPMFEKYPSISPYTYCANNPMKYVDPTGMDWIEREVEGTKEYFFDRKVTSQAMADEKYGKGAVTRLQSGTMVIGEGGRYKYILNNGNDNKGEVTDLFGNVMDKTKNIQVLSRTIIYATCDECLDPGTLYDNLFGTSYTGGNNPKTYSEKDNFDFKPRNPSEYGSVVHDKMYNAAGAKGLTDAFTNTNVWKADALLTAYNIINMANPAASFKDKLRSTGTAILFGGITLGKLTAKGVKKVESMIK